jgi:preprotein translocase subunit YajC
MNAFISDAFAQAPAGAPGAAGANFPMLLMLGGLFVAFYFLLIRPQTKRAKEHRAMVAALGKGDEVVTAGGTLGRITQAGDNFVTLEIAEGVEVKVQRHMIQTVMPKGTLKSVDEK